MDRTKDKIGYEINFNRLFYVYTPPRPLKEIDAELRELEQKIVKAKGIAGRNHFVIELSDLTDKDGYAYRACWPDEYELLKNKNTADLDMGSMVYPHLIISIGPVVRMSHGCR